MVAPTRTNAGHIQALFLLVLSLLGIHHTAEAFAPVRISRRITSNVNDKGTSCAPPMPIAATTTCKPISTTSTYTKTSPSSSSQLQLFDKMFEQEGALGKGITVGKVQVALDALNRGPDSIFAVLEKESARNAGSDDPSELAQLAHAVCLALLRRSDEWVGACSDSQWFKWDDAGKAESLYNDWSNREAAKFEKEYSGGDADDAPGGPTTVVVSIILEIQGDATQFEGAGFSIAGTQEVLSSVASDVNVGGGECLNAVEVFWTPGDREEVLTKQDLIMDFPELIDL